MKLVTYTDISSSVKSKVVPLCSDNMDVEPETSPKYIVIDNDDIGMIQSTQLNGH